MGDTGRKLGDRFGEHRRHVEKKKKKNDKDTSKPVPRRFNLRQSFQPIQGNRRSLSSPRQHGKPQKIRAKSY